MNIHMMAPHGLIRGENIEMGRDVDTGGQVRYVIDLARALGKCKEVDCVNLFTRQIHDEIVSSDYGELIEEIGSKTRIIRMPCGGDRYIRKEELWPFLDEFVDGVISFAKSEKNEPSVVHGHYADGGYIAKEVAAHFDVPFIFTGHSLGKRKLDYLLDDGMTREEACQRFKIDHRIHIEQSCLAAADLVITSSVHERDVQYKDYYKNDVFRFEVIPPGVDLKRFFAGEDPFRPSDDPFEIEKDWLEVELNRFLQNPGKPMIVTVSRPDKRKNLKTLIEAFGQNDLLRSKTNLVILAGKRDDISTMGRGEREALTELLLLMDKYDLYGKMAIPKHHNSEYGVPELFRYAAKTRGVFVNPTISESFGLATVEAAAVGLPFVASHNSGASDIDMNCQSGLLLDTSNPTELASGILWYIDDNPAWDKGSANGRTLSRKHYSWETHSTEYIRVARTATIKRARILSGGIATALGQQRAIVGGVLVLDIDDTLLGPDTKSLRRFDDVLKSISPRMAVVLASGRSLTQAVEMVRSYGLEDVDAILSSVGTEIYYDPAFIHDDCWEARIKRRWYPDCVRSALSRYRSLSLQQEEGAQQDYKISYTIKGVHIGRAMKTVHDLLAHTHCAYNLIPSHGVCVDIVPYQASKGRAVRYLAGKWNVPLNRVITVGDSGNDRDMLVGDVCGVVVGNHHEELDDLRGRGRVYFSEASYADGIVEGLRHYGFL